MKLLQILSFAVLIAATLLTQDTIAADANTNIHLRGKFQNARIRFEKKQQGHVAFIGGSITEMNGYRPMVMSILKKRFPKTKFNFTQAGISSTCSTTGAFRLKNHVLSKGPVDLFFIEFAVNDDQDAVHASRECIRGMEGIIRHTRRHNPYADIVITYFINPKMLQQWQAGKVPLSVAAHRRVAEHYNIPTINLAKETADQITAGKLTWKKFGGTHPGKPGNALCASMIARLMSTAWKSPLKDSAKKAKHASPKKPLDPRSYDHGEFIEPSKAKIVRDMVVQTPNWSKLKGQCRGRFVKDKLLCGEKAGAEITLDFEGTAIGAYILAGPDAGIVEVTIDGKPAKEINLYHRFSRGLHYPRTAMFATDLKPGKHTMRLKLSDKKDKRSIGNAMRVLQFVVNGQKAVVK